MAPRTVRLALVALALLIPGWAHAHRLLTIETRMEVHGDKVLISMRVVLLQACIVDKTESDEQSAIYPADRLSRAVQKYAGYLLERFSLVAGPQDDLRQLGGKLVRIEEPEYLDPSLYHQDLEKKLVTYHLEFPLVKPATRFIAIHRILNDEEYTPGVFWNVTLILDCLYDGKMVVQQMLVFPAQGVVLDMKRVDPYEKEDREKIAANDPEPVRAEERESGREAETVAAEPAKQAVTLAARTERSFPTGLIVMCALFILLMGGTWLGWRARMAASKAKP